MYSDYEDEFPDSGHIPAHILGNMWAQQWNSLLDELLPFPNRSRADVTDALKAQVSWLPHQSLRYAGIQDLGNRGGAPGEPSST